MKRKGILIMIAFLIMMAIFLCHNIVTKIAQNRKDNDLVQTMPNFTFISIDGHLIYSSNLQKNTLIIFFNSECEYCIDFTKKIIKDSTLIANNHVIMVSTENIENLNLFKAKFKIDLKRIYLCSCDYQNFANLFGNHLLYPTIFLYNANKKLIKKSSGDLNIEDLSHITY
jgi:thiol-disulfide isomerase/thioredoxin